MYTLDLLELATLRDIIDDHLPDYADPDTTHSQWSPEHRAAAISDLATIHVPDLTRTAGTATVHAAMDNYIRRNPATTDRDRRARDRLLTRRRATADDLRTQALTLAHTGAVNHATHLLGRARRQDPRAPHWNADLDIIRTAGQKAHQWPENRYVPNGSQHDLWTLLRILHAYTEHEQTTQLLLDNLIDKDRMHLTEAEEHQLLSYTHRYSEAAYNQATLNLQTGTTRTPPHTALIYHSSVATSVLNKLHASWTLAYTNPWSPEVVRALFAVVVWSYSQSDASERLSRFAAAAKLADLHGHI
ncbi:hypothetical protein [Nocardia brasiliensis]|uniref:hypothetical protein n=1 Tax=Nocardia brasiliensis TaxID=37326 RepID=UPI00245883C2|nr:hypothetical protein [Nocardia brasiliensis]